MRNIGLAVILVLVIGLIFYLLVNIALGASPAYEFNADAQTQDADSFRLETAVKNSTIFRGFFFQGTNDFIVSGNTYTLIIAESSSATSTLARISGSINGTLGTNVVEFTATTNTFSFSFDDFYTVILVESGNSKWSFARGKTECRRAIEIP